MSVQEEPGFPAALVETEAQRDTAWPKSVWPQGQGQASTQQVQVLL